MKLFRNITLLSIITCLIFSLPSTSKDRKQSSSRSRTSSARTSSSKSTPMVNSLQNIAAEIKSSKPEINEDNCDSLYMRCMNKVCDRGEMGRCACYEDKTINNISPSFVNIDGLSVKQGFQLFDFAKNECLYILDNCMENRRGITEKYKNFVQRDCLMLTEIEAEKEKGLAGDFTKLKECMKNPCTTHQPSGVENFDFPEYNICFNEAVAKFSIDAYCSNVVAESKTPLGLKDLFLNEMALGRERSCIAMGGTMTNDRKNCLVNISYGGNKQTRKGSKSVKVGEYLDCSASFFNVKQGLSKDFRGGILKRNLKIAGATLSTTGNILNMTLGAGTTTGAMLSGFNTGVEITKSVAYLGVDVVDYMKGDITAAELTQSSLSNLFSIAISVTGALAKTGAFDEALGKAAEIAGSGAAKVFGTDTGAAVKFLTEAGENLDTAITVLDTTSEGLDLGMQVTDVVVQAQVDKEIKQEEQLAIIKHAEVDRTTGMGMVSNPGSITERGHCFLNDEWIATENEVLLLLWKY